MEVEFDYLDTPLLEFSEQPEDLWTIRNAVAGVQIFGGIGSGKSSGSGKTLAYSYLENGFGGIVLTGKVDETTTWLKYAKKTNRLKDVVIFGATRPLDGIHEDFRHKFNKEYQFNPLSYLSEKKETSGKTANIVALFMSIIKAGDRISGMGGGSSNDPFWDRALQRMIKSTIDLLKLAQEGTTKKKTIDLLKLTQEETTKKKTFDLSVANISKVIRDTQLLLDDKKEGGGDYVTECLISAGNAAAQGSESTKRIFEAMDSYFKIDFGSMPENVRSSVLESFYAFADPFLSGLLADYFASDVEDDVRPEKTFGEDKIIIIDFPVKEYLQVGIYAQTIYKRLWQQAVERRKVDKTTKPVFMWVDEAQFFLSEDDMMFQTTARSSRACTVMISQNISNYYATIGGKNPRDRVNSLLGNLSTKIFHANNDYVTNEWAAKTIGQTRQPEMSMNMGDERHSTTMKKALQNQVEPQDFTLLRNGGKTNQFQVDGIVTVSGKPWSNGRNYIQTFFYQNEDEFFVE
ncbi:MAG: TraM recognition domain-containing protein [Bacteroidota bacterium]